MKQLQAVNEVEAAKILSLSVQTLRNWRGKKIGPQYIKLSNRCIRYRVVDIQDFVQQHLIMTEEV